MGKEKKKFNQNQTANKEFDMKVVYIVQAIDTATNQPV